MIDVDTIREACDPERSPLTITLCDEVKQLRSDLFRYGDHRRICPTRVAHIYGSADRPPCDCGFDQLTDGDE